MTTEIQKKIHDDVFPCCSYQKTYGDCFECKKCFQRWEISAIGPVRMTKRFYDNMCQKCIGHDKKQTKEIYRMLKNTNFRY